MINVLIEHVKSYIGKSLDAGVGLFSTGVIFSISNNGSDIANFETNWGTLVAGFSTAILMIVRVIIMIRKEKRDHELHDKELKK